MRKFNVLAVSALSFAIAGVAMVRADDPPAPASPATQPSAAKAGNGHVSFKPFSGLMSLTDDQAAKINAIHKKFLDEQRELTRKHEADIMAVLSDDQKAELKTLHEKDLADGKAKRADAKQKMKDEKPDLKEEKPK